MFVTYEQFYVATLTFAMGYIFAIIYGVCIFPFDYLKSRVLKAIVSVIICLLFTCVYYYIYVVKKFPDFRIYMPICVVLGFYAERKTLHLPLANSLKKVYNMLDRKRG